VATLSTFTSLNITALGGRTFPVVSIDVDRSSGPTRGRIWVAFTNYDPDENANLMDIFAAWSTDRGETWADPIKVNQDNTDTAQLMPWLDVDDADGSVGVVYYSAQRDPLNNKALDVYYAQFDGNNWTNKRVSDVASSVGPGGYRDYIGLHEQDNTAYMAWTSFADGGEAEIFYTKVPGIFAVPGLRFCDS
jgi:Neuraminidase (sialidase)